MQSCHEPYQFVVVVLPVAQPQFVRNYVHCVQSLVVGGIWEGHMLHGQLQLPVQEKLSFLTVRVNRHS
jgi:hypothetical protein